MSSIFDWSTDPGDNASADGDINWAEGQAPSTVNNSARAMMARIAEFLADLGGALEAGGTANALTLTANSSFTAYAQGLILAFKAGADNTGAATLNVNGIGAKALRKITPSGEVALAAGNIKAGGIFVAAYDEDANEEAGAWLLLTPAISAADLGAQPLHANLTALAGLSLIADRLPYANGTGTLALATFTAAGRALVDDADAAAQRATLGLGTIATQAADNVTITGGTITGGSVALSTLGNGTALSLLGRSANSAGTRADIVAASDHQVLRRSGAGVGFGSVALNQAAATTGALPVNRGGTGAADASGARDNLAAETRGEAVGVNSQTGTSYTLVLDDMGKIVERWNADPNTLTVPPNSSVAFPTNTRIDILQYGAGQTTIVAGDGVTIRAAGSNLKLRTQFSGASLYKRGTNEWVLVGDLVS